MATLLVPVELICFSSIRKNVGKYRNSYFLTFLIFFKKINLLLVFKCSLPHWHFGGRILVFWCVFYVVCLLCKLNKILLSRISLTFMWNSLTCPASIVLGRLLWRKIVIKFQKTKTNNKSFTPKLLLCRHLFQRCFSGRRPCKNTTQLSLYD